MRDAFSQFLPIVNNDLTGMMVQTGIPTVNNHVHVSSNGYYGYEAVQHKQDEQVRNNGLMNQQDCEMDIQFNNYIETEPFTPNHTTRVQQAKKRMCDFDMDPRDFKKRRESEPISITPAPPSTTKHATLRQPTHNMPDMPRRIMGHYV